MKEKSDRIFLRFIEILLVLLAVVVTAWQSWFMISIGGSAEDELNMDFVQECVDYTYTVVPVTYKSSGVFNSDGTEQISLGCFFDEEGESIEYLCVHCDDIIFDSENPYTEQYEFEDGEQYTALKCDFVYKVSDVAKIANIRLEESLSENWIAKNTFHYNLELQEESTQTKDYYSFVYVYNEECQEPNIYLSSFVTPIYAQRSRSLYEFVDKELWYEFAQSIILSGLAILASVVIHHKLNGVVSQTEKDECHDEEDNKYSYYEE